MKAEWERRRKKGKSKDKRVDRKAKQDASKQERKDEKAQASSLEPPAMESPSLDSLEPSSPPEGEAPTPEKEKKKKTKKDKKAAAAGVPEAPPATAAEEGREPTPPKKEKSKKGGRSRGNSASNLEARFRGASIESDRGEGSKRKSLDSNHSGDEMLFGFTPGG